MPCTPGPGGVEAEQRKTPGSGVRHGAGDQTGRFTNCPRLASPPPMSPPSRLALAASSAAGPITCRASTRSRNPGANRSICASIAPVMSTADPLGTWQ